MLKKAILAAIFSLAAAQAANASVVTVNASFEATDWAVYFGSPSAPIDPLFLDFSATFDDSLTYVNDTSVLTVHSTNIPYAFNFSYANQTMVLATAGSQFGCGHPPASFCAFMNEHATTPFFVEQSPDGGGGWVARTIKAGPSGAPEPAAWTMMIGGFGLAGAALRRRRTAVA